MSYEGTFERERAHGEGRLEMVKGDNYVGGFKKGKKEGKGIFRFRKEIFYGNWANNQFIFNS